MNQRPSGNISDEVRQFTVDHDDDGIRLDRWFKRHLPQIGFGTVSKWARTGQIRVDGKRVKAEDRVATGQMIRVPPGGEPSGRGLRVRNELTHAEEAEADAMLIERTDSALVLNKPAGLATQGGTKTTKHVDGLLDAFAGADEPRPKLVHRLDKDTSGVLLVARTSGSAAFYSKQFAGRGVKKIYWALVVGVPRVQQGTIDAPIGKQPGSGGEKMCVDEQGGQSARTLYRVIERAGNAAAWVELQPLTGRTHQLRVHLAALGHPIVGDGKYGGQDAFLTGTISRKMHLHARRLIIDEPKGGKLDVTANLPEHFAASMEQLGFDASLSDASPDEGRQPPTREEQKQIARQHAKQYRKGRRGERTQGRSPTDSAGGPRKRPGDRPKGKDAGAQGSKPAGKPSGRPGGKPAGKPPARGKPAGRPTSKPSSVPRGKR